MSTEVNSATQKRRLFLHVGTHKTGSTSVQWALTKSRALLAGRGICYPHTGCPTTAQLGQHQLAWSLVRRPGYLPVAMKGKLVSSDERADLWRRLRAEIAETSAQTVVLSSEEFDMFTVDEIGDLARELADFDVTPVLFLRNAAEFMESSYRTAIVYSGCAKPIDEFVANQRSRLDYADMLRDWSEPFGGAVAFAYDDPEIRSSVVAAFLSLLDIKLEEISADAQRAQNESLPASACALAVFLRRQGVSEPDVRAWLTSLQSSQRSSARYTLMPTKLGDELTERYYTEVLAISSNQRTGLDVRGLLSAGCAPQAATVIDSQAAALLALPKELNLGQPAAAPASAPQTLPPAPPPRSVPPPAPARRGDVTEAEWSELWIRQATHGDVAALPPLAPVARQQLLHGTTGVAAMQGALKFRQVIRGRIGALPPSPRLLDFGCGWGRHIRIFLKDFDPGDITGVDIDPDNIALCRDLLPGIRFVLSRENEQLPVEPDSMDLMMSFSVFSHINEESAKFWLNELARLLRPGGSLVVTSWGQAMFEIHDDIRATGREPRSWEGNMLRCFPDMDDVKRRYRAGEFMFGKHLTTGVLDPEVYGLSLMPKEWIERNTNLRVANWLEDTNIVPQTTFFLTK